MDNFNAKEETAKNLTNQSSRPYLGLKNTGAFLLLALFPITGVLGFHNLLLENGKRRFFRHLSVDIFFVIIYFCSFLSNLRRERYLSSGEVIEAFVILVAIISYIVAIVDGIRFSKKRKLSPAQPQASGLKKNNTISISISVILFLAALVVDFLAIRIVFAYVGSRASMYGYSILISSICSIFALISLISDVDILLSNDKSVFSKQKINLISLNIVSSLNILGLTFWILTFSSGLA